MPNYGDASYWDERYKDKNTTFDWLESWANIKFEIERHTITNLDKISDEERKSKRLE